MNKEEVQQCVLKNGKPLALNKFTWDTTTKSFSTNEMGLVIDFRDQNFCTFKTGSNCTFKTGRDCTFNTDEGCTFDTGGGCTFDTSRDCVIVNRNVFEVIQPKEGQTIQICPSYVEGHLVDGMYKGEPHIIADGILSKIIKQKGDVYKVVNHGDTKESYLVKQGDIYAHGKTIKEAREAIKYKLADRDTSKWEGLTPDDEISKKEAIQMYMAVTGVCSEGTRYFVENNDVPEKAKLSEIIKLTQGQYGHDQFKQFVERNVC